MATTSKEPQRHTPAGPVPASILDDEQLNAAISTYLPANYNFEIHKTIHHVRHYGSQCVALQMPEGLTLWATSISDIVERFTDATTVIMGDVTYGACCVDDFTARALGADLLVHYGHSCLVPVDQTSIRTLYVFVEIAIDASHVCATIRSNFPSTQAEFRATITDKEKEQSKAKLQIGIEGADGGASAPPRPTHLVLVATVQFINALHNIKDHLEQSESYEDFYDAGRTTDQAGSDPAERRLLTLAATSSSSAMDEQEKPTTKQTWFSSAYRVTIPQVKPLSQGEILGCTSPKLPSGVEDSVDGIIYLGDGRFHLESIMIANPRLPAFRYDPYEKRFVREGYDHTLMRRNRANAVQEAKSSLDAFSTPAAAVPDIEGNGKVVASSVPPTKGWGLVLGTLGRQGSVRVLSHLRSMLEPRSVPTIPILLSELSPQKLALFGESLAAFVQTSCPRLSIDWGDAFAKPLLSPYEAAVALEKAPGWRSTASKRLPTASTTAAPKAPAHVQVELEKGHEEGSVGKAGEEDDHLGDYPMDYYADGSLGPWTPRHGLGVRKSNAKGISNRELLRRGRGGAAAAARRTAAV